MKQSLKISDGVKKYVEKRDTSIKTSFYNSGIITL